MNTHEIRKKFIQFFESKQHTFVPSASTVPKGDQTILFTIAGMAQFKSCLTGEEVRFYKRATNSQKCIRVADLDDVGKDGRHLTMFEMLGSWSFGDYGKKEAIVWAYEYVKDILKLDCSRLWISVHESDNEAADIWKSSGVSPDRIVKLGDKDNFWAMGPTGPCGPCSELYFDQGEDVGKDYHHGDVCQVGPGCDCDRYLEFWNLVFMEFNRQEDGRLLNLPLKSVDTGSGLERVAAILQGKSSAFDTDTFVRLKTFIFMNLKLSVSFHDLNDGQIQCLNILADHMRLLTFTLGDGITFSNEGRGYVLRRVLRRAVRVARKLNPNLSKTDSFLALLVQPIVDEFGEFYPEIKSQLKFIQNQISIEELKFNVTLDSGLSKFNGFIEEARRNKSTFLSGEQVFILHDSYGFPSDLTQILCQDIGFQADIVGFQKHMQDQQQRSRAEAKFYKFDSDDSPWLVFHSDDGSESIFSGYHLKESHKVDGSSFAVVEKEFHQVRKLRQLKNKDFELVLSSSPFYPEGGGQVSDVGFVHFHKLHETMVFEVLDARKTPSHIALLLRPHDLPALQEQFLSLPDLTKFFADVSMISCHVNMSRRQNTARHHTATHLLHKALQLVCGEHVRQAGSFVHPDGLRFDFTHPKALTKEQCLAVETIVNEQIMNNVAIKTYVDVPIESAKSMGAMAMFDEKYEENVRVLEVPGFSLELCGGTHVQSTGEIGCFKLISEGSVNSGVRRIEAVVGSGAMNYIQNSFSTLTQLSQIFKCSQEDVISKCDIIRQQQKLLESQIDILSQRLAGFIAKDLIEKSYPLLNDIKLIVSKVIVHNTSELEAICDHLKGKNNIICLLASEIDGKAQVMSAIPKVLLQQNKTLNAGKLVSFFCEKIHGKGGGRPDFARGGGSELALLDSALQQAKEFILQEFCPVKE